MAMMTEKGYCTFFINQNEVASSKDFLDINNTATSSNNPTAINKTATNDFSTYQSFFLGTEAIYYTLKSGKTFKCPLDRYSQRIDLSNSEECEDVNLSLLNEKFINQHLQIYQSLKTLNGTVMLAHGKILSIYSLSASKWVHFINKNSSKSDDISKKYIREKTQKDKSQNYFGFHQNEVANMNFIKSNDLGVYEILVETHGNTLLKLVYYSNGIVRNNFVPPQNPNSIVLGRKNSSMDETALAD